MIHFCFVAIGVHNKAVEAARAKQAEGKQLDHEESMYAESSTILEINRVQVLDQSLLTTNPLYVSSFLNDNNIFVQTHVIDRIVNVRKAFLIWSREHADNPKLVHHKSRFADYFITCPGTSIKTQGACRRLIKIALGFTDPAIRYAASLMGDTEETEEALCKCWTQSTLEHGSWTTMDTHEFLHPENHSPDSAFSKKQIWMFEKLMYVFQSGTKPYEYVTPAALSYDQFTQLEREVNEQLEGLRTEFKSLDNAAVTDVTMGRLYPTTAVMRIRQKIMETIKLDAELPPLKKGTLHKELQAVVDKLKEDIKTVVAKYTVVVKKIERGEEEVKEQQEKFSEAARVQALLTQNTVI
jgi:hypothetical protein